MALQDLTTQELKACIDFYKQAATDGRMSTATAIKSIHVIEDVLHERELLQRREGDDVDGGRRDQDDHHPQEQPR